MALIILLLTTFFPANGTFNILRILIVIALFFITKETPKNDVLLRYRNLIIILWFVSIIVAMAAVFFVEGDYNQTTLLHEIERLVFYTLLLFLCPRIRTTLSMLFWCCVGIIGIHFFIQVTQYLHLGTFDDFIRTYYVPDGEFHAHFSLAFSEEGFRSGSIFLNPNVYVCYPYLSLGVFLEYFKRTRSSFVIVAILISFLSILLSGSRMGMVAYLSILLWFIFFRGNNNQYQNPLFYLGLLIFFIVILFFINDIGSFMNNQRSFSFESAFEGSGGAKRNLFSLYLESSPPIYWITGSLGSLLYVYQIDMEIGYIFAWFGLLGVVWYYLLLKTIYKYNQPKFKIIGTVAIIAILATAMGASSILNLSVFPFICALTLSRIQDKIKETNKKDYHFCQ